MCTPFHLGHAGKELHDQKREYSAFVTKILLPVLGHN